MAENSQSTQNLEDLRIHNVELAHLGALCVEASLRTDLSEVAAQQASETGVANPNSVGTGLFPNNKDSVEMRADNAYRQVGEEAIEDLAESGLVRNGATAKGQLHPRWGHKVFFVSGEDGKPMSTGGRFVIEANKKSTNSWLTADKVKGIHAKDSDGKIKNILPES